MLKARPCDKEGCGQHIVFLKTESGASMPVDAESLDVRDDEDTLFDNTRHVSHFGTCTDPGKFRREPRKAKSSWKYLRLLEIQHGIEIPIAIAGDRVRIRWEGKTVEAKLVDSLDAAMPVRLEHGDEHE